MELTLYYRPSCPFCQKVLAYMEETSTKVPIADISYDDEAENLIAVGGKQQVPCLVVDGQAMYESDDIIDWMKENWLYELIGGFIVAILIIVLFLIKTMKLNHPETKIKVSYEK